MNTRKCWILVLGLAVCLVVLASVSVWAGANKKSYIERVSSGEITIDEVLNEVRREPLVGLEGLLLIVGKLSSVEEQYGLTGLELRTDVELRLRQSGIKFEGKDWEKTQGKPCLLIWVKTLVPKVISNDSVVVDINVELQEDAVLLRNPKIYIPTVTWRRNWLGIITIDGFEDHIRGFIKDSVDQFCNDYLAANPKEQ